MRFRGRTPGEAMKHAREELGAEARLVSARRVSPAGLPPVYEVRVTGSAPAAAVSAEIGDLKREIHELRSALSSLAGSAPAAVAAPEAPAAPESSPEESGADLEEWLELLIRRGVGESRARSLVNTAARHLEDRLHAEPRDAVRAAIADSFGPRRRHDRLGERPTIFVGPTGAGKTTTLAKTAADLAARGARPTLVCADGESLTGEENLEAVAAALNLPFEPAFLDGQLEELVRQRGEERIYLVDTAGLGPHDEAARAQLRTLAAALPDPEIVLVLPSATDRDEAARTCASLRPLGVERVVLTKLDEAALPGRILDLAAGLDLPVARVTYGRSVRGAGAMPGDEAIVARILGSELAVRGRA